MWLTDAADTATQILKMQLQWLNAIGPVSAALSVLLALTIGFAVGRWTGGGDGAKVSKRG